MATLPSWTRTLDNAFVETWYDIKAVATDNILNATPVWALLKNHGCFKPQTGSDLITETIKYAVGVTPVAVSKGDTLPMGVVETETMARWTFRNVAANIQRDTITDVENSGPAKIKDYVKKRTTEARDALAQKYETDLLRAVVTAETGKEIQGLNDMLPPYASATTGTYGQIARPSAFTAGANGVLAPSGGNTFWGSKYLQLVAPYEVNLISNMRSLYNAVHNNQEVPNLILSSLDLFELYEEFAVDKSQIVKNDAKFLADLGFNTLQYKGATWTWSPNMTANNMMMLNTKHIKIKYRPNLWFDMTEWKQAPLDMTRIAHILCAMNLYTDQPRRHGLLYA
jgi:hypothetical protein